MKRNHYRFIIRAELREEDKEGEGREEGPGAERGGGDCLNLGDDAAIWSSAGVRREGGTLVARLSP
jgi:hypothetical protein